MYHKLRNVVVEQVRQRHSEGDCPITPAVDREVLEFALLDLADLLQPAPVRDHKPDTARRCDTNLVGVGGECTECQADQGEACRTDPLFGDQGVSK